MNIIEKLFQGMHARELVNEYGLAGGFLAGLIIAVEQQGFPFWMAVRDLLNHEGTFALRGATLTYTAWEWHVRPGGTVLNNPVLLSVDHAFDLRYVLVWVVVACIIGSIGAGTIKKNVRRPDKKKVTAPKS